MEEILEDIEFKQVLDMERGIKDLSMFDLSCMKLIEIEVVEMFIEKLF